jgi:hypothetical protein
MLDQIIINFFFNLILINIKITYNIPLIISFRKKINLFPHKSYHQILLCSDFHLIHQYNEYDYHQDWDSDYNGCHSWGSVDNYDDSTNDTSKSASYNYSADWNWNRDGEKSSSVTNQVTGHNGYSHDSYYNNSSESYCDYGCGYSCSSSDSCSYSCTYFDYNESVQYTGWGALVR